MRYVDVHLIFWSGWLFCFLQIVLVLVFAQIFRHSDPEQEDERFEEFEDIKFKKTKGTRR